MRYQRFIGRYAAAVATGEKALESGKTCRSQPRGLIGTMLVPLIRLGRREEAATLQKRHQSLVRRSSDHPVCYDHDITALALLGDLAGAQRLFERHHQAGLTAVDQNDRFEFIEAARLWAELALIGGPARRKVRLTDVGPPADAAGRVDMGELTDWLAAEAGALADRFDARNGTAEFRRRMDELPELLDLAAAG